METKSEDNLGRHVRPVAILAVVSLVLCGLLFPLIVTGVAQLALPYQANGELAKVGGHTVGSMVAVNSTDYTLPVFFHPRNDSASGFDPDITVQDAESQVVRISNASGVPQAAIQALVSQDEQGTWLGIGTPYVDVQQLNLQLIAEFPAQYSGYG